MKSKFKKDQKVFVCLKISLENLPGDVESSVVFVGSIEEEGEKSICVKVGAENALRTVDKDLVFNKTDFKKLIDSKLI